MIWNFQRRIFISIYVYITVDKSCLKPCVFCDKNRKNALLMFIVSVFFVGKTCFLSSERLREEKEEEKGSKRSNQSSGFQGRSLVKGAARDQKVVAMVAVEIGGNQPVKPETIFENFLGRSSSPRFMNRLQAEFRVKFWDSQNTIFWLKIHQQGAVEPQNQLKTKHDRDRCNENVQILDSKNREKTVCTAEVLVDLS